MLLLRVRNVVVLRVRNVVVESRKCCLRVGKCCCVESKILLSRVRNVHYYSCFSLFFHVFELTSHFLKKKKKKKKKK